MTVLEVGGGGGESRLGRDEKVAAWKLIVRLANSDPDPAVQRACARYLKARKGDKTEARRAGRVLGDTTKTTKARMEALRELVDAVT